MDVEKIVRLVICEHLGVDKDKIVLTQTLDDLGADSLDYIELTMGLEDEFNISIDDGYITKMKTVEDIIKIINELS